MTPLTRRYQFAIANRSPPGNAGVLLRTIGGTLVRGKEGTIIGKMG